ncbi:MAG: GntR family transcriptional regulator [Azospirillum brasilense]|nr:MAG: GntR family transcriptional regulator [Azospirillum brasilense]
MREQIASAGRKQSPAKPSVAKRDGQGVDRLAGSLRNAILERALMPGAKLPEAGIAEIFGVSRTVVRGALAQLLSEGLVVQTPNRSTTVAQPDLAEAGEIFAVRAMLEGMVMNRLSGRLSAAQAKELRDHVEHQKAAANRAEAIRLGGAFHLKLAACCGGGVLHRYVGELVTRCSLVFAAYGPPPHADSECGVREHTALIDALEEGRTREAEQLMHRHIGAISGRYTPPGPERRGDLAARLAAYAKRDR